METTIGNLTRRERRAMMRMAAAEGSKCSLADLLFPVEKRENPLPANSEYEFVIIGQLPTEDNPTPGDFFLNACSSRYALIPNEEIFPKIEAILNNTKGGIKFEVTYKHIDNVRFYADYKITDPRYGYTMKGTKGDTIQPLIRVQHSYNGLTKYKIIFGYFRFICTNGLVIAIEEMKAFNLVLVGKHTESVRRSLLELEHTLTNFANNAAELTEALTAKYEILASIDYAGGTMVQSVRNRIEEVLKASKVLMVEQKDYKTLDLVFNNVMREASNPLGAGASGKVTDWMIYNAINSYLYDPSRTAAEPEKKMEADSKVFEYMIRYNKATAPATEAFAGNN